MNRTRRFLATLVTTAALVAPTGLTLSAAEAAKPTATGKPAKPTKPTKTASSQAAQLLQDIAVRDQQLARLAVSDTVTALADATEAQLVATVAEARATLAALRAAVEAPGSTVDTRAARRALHAFRVENLSQAAGLLAQVEALTPAAVDDPEAQAFLAGAHTGALAIRATSTKAEVRAVRVLVAAAEAELAPVVPVV